MNPRQALPPINLPPINGPDGSNGDYSVQPQTFVSSQPLPVISPLGDNKAQTINNGQQISSPQTADDVDLIEKEWIHRVKEIIESTKNDPFEQSRQLTMLKADYLQKRYNKSINLS